MFSDLINLFFPKVCYACLHLLNDNEDTICTSCRHDLPVTNYHFDGYDRIAKVLYGRAKIEQGTALFRFEKKSIVQRLIHGLKYKEYEQIGVFLGNWLGAELETLETYRTIDMVIPVPLHKNKLKVRGYNQVTKFGQQIASALNIHFREDLLIKTTDTKSQTQKNRFSRWTNNTELFVLTDRQAIENKHILLVDDIITTGATIEACVFVLNQATNIKISIATMAIAT